MVAITDSDGWVSVTRPEITDIALGGNETNFPGKYFRELASRDKYLYETALGGDATAIASSVAFRQLGIAAVAQGRLTLETGVPVSTANQTAKTVLYYTSYNGDYVALYNTVKTRWDLFQFTERSLSLSGLAANTNYDIFIWDNSGTLTLQAVAWASSGAGTSNRASAITQLNGVWVKNSDKRRYLGTIRTTATTGQCEDSVEKRYVWNVGNRELRQLYKPETTVAWSYLANTFRPYNNSTANRCEVVVGLVQPVSINLSVGIVLINTVPTETAAVAIGLDSTTTPVAGQSYGDMGSEGTAIIINCQVEARFNLAVTEGYHYLQALERGANGIATVFEGTNGGIVSGLTGGIFS